MSWRRVSRSRLLRDPISLILSWIRFAQLSVKLTRQPSRDCRLCGAPRVEFDLTRFLKVRAHHARCTALSRCRAAGRRFPASVCICTSQVKLGSRSATRCVRVRSLSTCAIAPTANVGPARSFSMGMPVARESFAVVIGTPERVDCAAPSGSQTVHSHCPVCRIRTHSEPQAYPEVSTCAQVHSTTPVGLSRSHKFGRAALSYGHSCLVSLSTLPSRISRQCSRHSRKSGRHERRR